MTTAGWRRGESRGLGGPSATTLCCLFAFLPGTLTDFIKIRIHSFNKGIPGERGRRKELEARQQEPRLREADRRGLCLNPAGSCLRLELTGSVA